MGVPVPSKVTPTRLREMYFVEKHIRPGVQQALEDGVLLADDVAAAMDAQGIPRTAESVGEVMAKWVDPTTGAGTKHTKATLKYFSRLPEKALETGLFGDDIAQEFMHYIETAAAKQADLRVLHSFLRQDEVRVPAGTPEAQNLAKAWKDAGFNKRGLRTWVQEHLDVFGAQSVDDLVARQPANIANAKDPLNAFVNSLHVSKQAATTLGAFAQLHKPKAIGDLTKLVDQVTNLYRSHLTIGFPSFHLRNRLSSIWQHLTDGLVTVGDEKRVQRAVLQALKGQGDAEVAGLLEEAVASGLLKNRGRLQMIAGGAAGTAEKLPTAWGWAKHLADPASWKKGGWNPLHARGSFMKEGDNLFALFGAGEKAYDLVETLNRGGYYVALRQKGFSPGQAMYWVKRADFDYGEASRFVEDVGRRAVPFIQWISKNIPYQLQKLLERPGGAAAQTYRLVTQSGHDRESYVPSFLREMMGIRAGGEDKAAHFVRQAGIPIEDLNRFVFGPGPLGALSTGVPQTRTLQKWAGNLSPPIIAPFEMFAGKQMWTGRKFEDMASPTERLTETVLGKDRGVRSQLADRLLSTSPTARYLSEGMSAIDPRKSWWMKLMNVLTGVKVSTYDLPAAQLKDLITAMHRLAGKTPYVREGEHFYVPKRYRKLARGRTGHEIIRRLAALHQEAKTLRAKREAEEAR